VSPSEDACEDVVVINACANVREGSHMFRFTTSCVELHFLDFLVATRSLQEIMQLNIRSNKSRDVAIRIAFEDECVTNASSGGLERNATKHVRVCRMIFPGLHVSACD
jgi:hypothetical protein